MGMISPTIASNSSAQGGGKGGSMQQVSAPEQSNQPMGKGSTTNSATSGQPQFGNPAQNIQMEQDFGPRRNFPNTVGQWDNASIEQKPNTVGKGKGA